jgi:hypothetical protein
MLSVLALEVLVLTPSAVACQPFPAAAPSPDLEVTGGIGGGSYVFPLPLPLPRVAVPFRELGLEVQRRTGTWGFGVQASLREDEEGEASFADPMPPTLALSGIRPPDVSGVVAHTSRYRIAPFVTRQFGPHVHAKGGVVLSNYYSPTGSGASLFPLASIGVGNDMYSMDLGVFDSPALASSADGGLGSLAFRAHLRVHARHKLMMGIGSLYSMEDYTFLSVGSVRSAGYASYGYEWRAGDGFTVGLGGFITGVTTGNYVQVSRDFW